MKKNNLKNIIIVNVILFVVALLSSFIIYNFDLFFISSENRGEKEIDFSNLNYEGFKYTDDKLVSISDKKVIMIDYKGYINKVIINYSCEDNININVNYEGNNYFNKMINKELTDSFNSRLDTSVVKVGDKVNKISININDSSDLIIDSIKLNNKISFNWYLFVYILTFLMIILTIFAYCYKNLFNKKIEYLFLSVSILIGNLFVLFQPYTTSISWDDQIHYSTTYRIFELDGKTEWTQAAHDMTEISPFISVNTKEERVLENKYLNDATDVVKVETNSPLIQYNQIGYLLPGAIIKICSVLKVPFVVTMILSKLTILLTYIVLMFFAIKIIPRGKRIVSFIGLLPTSIFLATQFSYDTPIIGGIALFIALFLKIIEDKKQVDFVTCILLILSIIIASFIKAIYIPLILLALFIPKNRFKTKKQNIFFKIGIIMIFLSLLSTFVLPTITQTSALGDLRGGNTSTSGQVSNIFAHPIGYANLLKVTAGKEFTTKLIGHGTLDNFAYIDVSNKSNIDSDRNVYNVILILLLFVVITDSYNEKKELCKKKKLILRIFSLALILGIILLIWTALYISFTPVGDITINGVQSRYFIPLLVPLILMCLDNNKIKVDFNLKKYDAIIMTIMVVVLLYLIYTNLFVQFCL